MVQQRTTSAAEMLARAGVDLHLELRGTGVRAGLTAALREAVRSGHLVAGTRLPGSRALAEDLGIARSTVTESYSALIEEGWLVARHGSGTRVADRAAARKQSDGLRLPVHRSAHGLGPGAADYAEFPRSPWLAAARRVFASVPHSAFGYGDPLGRMELRSALADYLARVRGVYADASRIVICSGFHHGLGMLARALREHGTDAIAVEGFGLDIYREVLGDERLQIPALEVDEEGALVDDLRDLDVGAVLLTPAHQFPTGFALSTERRMAVLDWARSTGSVILEDDYDGEFRYDRKPIGALQGLDPDHVVYFGTASKSIAPALRLAWIVVPEYLLPAVARAKGRVDTVSVLDQLIFTEFMTSGSFDRHVRGRRQSYRHRREQLLDALAEKSPEVRVTGMAAGLQALVTLPTGTEGAALQAAARQGLKVSGLSEFRHPEAGAKALWRDGLVINFSAVSDSVWPRALESLSQVLSWTCTEPARR